jgi:2'-5' RNA ligase
MIFFSSKYYILIKTYENKEILIKALEECNIKPLALKVDSFCLFKSVLSKDGPKYTKLKEFTLT